MPPQSLVHCLIIVLISVAFPPTVKAQPREPAVPISDMVAVELATVVLIRGTNIPVALLREPTRGHLVPIFIGLDQAQSIVMALHQVELPRPNSHDLMQTLLASLQAEVSRVFVDSLVADTYYGLIELIPKLGKPLLVDARPSDALALALRTGATIWVAPELLANIPQLQFDSLGQQDIVSAAGITVMAVSQELRQALNLPATSGVLVSRSVGHAAQAGLKAGALITQVNNASVATPMAFLEALRSRGKDRKISLQYWQDGQTHSIEFDTSTPTVPSPAPSPDPSPPARWM